MARTSDTRELTHEAFWDLLRNGDTPSVPLVQAWLRERTGTARGTATIHSELKTCKQELATLVKNKTTLPDLPEDTVALVVELRDRMAQQAAEQFESERSTLNQQLQEKIHAAEQQVAKAEQRCREMGTQLEATGQDCRTWESTASTWQGKCQDKEKEFVELQATHQFQAKELERKKETLEQLKADLVSLQECRKLS